jgi:hypothetical protein
MWTDTSLKAFLFTFVFYLVSFSSDIALCHVSQDITSSYFYSATETFHFMFKLILEQHKGLFEIWSVLNISPQDHNYNPVTAYYPTNCWWTPCEVLIKSCFMSICVPFHHLNQLRISNLVQLHNECSLCVNATSVVRQVTSFDRLGWIDTAYWIIVHTIATY